MTSSNPWRIGLFVGVVIVTSAGWIWMFAASPELRASLGILLGAFAIGAAGLVWRERARLDMRLITANLALGSIVHLMLAAGIVGGSRLWELGVLPALSANWHHFLIGLLGIVGTFVTWSRARGGSDVPVVRSRDAEPEPAPIPTPELETAPDWDELAGALEGRKDAVRLRSLHALERLEAVLSEGDLDGAKRVVRQEARRLVSESEADEREEQEEDILSQAAALLEWGAQKIPELAELDASDVVMAKAIADIKSNADEVVQTFVDHRELLPIHPITRETAEEKCEERAEAARKALPLLEANGMRMSEDLIAAHEELDAFRSVTGFQVVELLDGGFVTFEGNGRREALQRAFGDDRGVQIEVRLYTFEDPEVRATIDRRVHRVRRWKGLE